MARRPQNSSMAPLPPLGSLLLLLLLLRARSCFLSIQKSKKIAKMTIF
jgi:hypothetical protein